MSELKKRHRQIREKKVLNREDVYHGALEDILLGRCYFMMLTVFTRLNFILIVAFASNSRVLNPSQNEVFSNIILEIQYLE